MSVHASSVAGALLAVPLLASFKIICDRIRPLTALGHFVGGESHNVQIFEASNAELLRANAEEFW